jgi:hypothetical protein
LAVDGQVKRRLFFIGKGFYLEEDFVMEVRNPVFNKRGTIDCEINHPVYGWIPFTASPDDCEDHGRAIYDALYNVSAPYIE